MEIEMKAADFRNSSLTLANTQLFIYSLGPPNKHVFDWQKTKTHRAKWVQYVGFSSEALITGYQMDDKRNLWSISFALFWSVLTFKVKPGLASFHLTVIAHAGWAHLVEKVIILWSSCCNKTGHNPHRQTFRWLVGKYNDSAWNSPQIGQKTGPGIYLFFSIMVNQ